MAEPTPPPRPPEKKRRPPKPPEQRALIVAAWVEPDDLAFFHDLRRRFFPGHRNFLSAHVTLFHHIRAQVRGEFIEFAKAHVRDQPYDQLRLTVKPPFSMGKGVAYGIEAQPLIELRTPLREKFLSTLTDQDKRPWKKPHITVQNKVEKHTAKTLARRLLARYDPACTIRVKGLEFYRYDYGPWTLLDRAAFGKG